MWRSRVLSLFLHDILLCADENGLAAIRNLQDIEAPERCNLFRMWQLFVKLTYFYHQWNSSSWIFLNFFLIISIQDFLHDLQTTFSYLKCIIVDQWSLLANHSTLVEDQEQPVNVAGPYLDTFWAEWGWQVRPILKPLKFITTSDGSWRWTSLCWGSHSINSSLIFL